MRIEQLEEKVGKFDVMFLEWYQQPQQPCRIPPHPGDAYRHNASDKKTRSSSDSSLGQGTTYLPPPISRVCRQTISNDSTSSHAIYGHAENGYSDGRDIEYVKATDRMLEEYAPILVSTSAYIPLCTRLCMSGLYPGGVLWVRTNPP